MVRVVDLPGFCAGRAFGRRLRCMRAIIEQQAVAHLPEERCRRKPERQPLVCASQIGGRGNGQREQRHPVKGPRLRQLTAQTLLPYRVSKRSTDRPQSNEKELCPYL